MTEIQDFGWQWCRPRGFQCGSSLSNIQSATIDDIQYSNRQTFELFSWSMYLKRIYCYWNSLSC